MIEKFKNLKTTADGQIRASVDLDVLETIWFNTGTLCNLECKNCYIESSPTNDRLSYLTVADIEQYLIEIKELGLSQTLVGLTGGEPFLNPSIMNILSTVLSYGHNILVLTNANRVLKKHKTELLKLKSEFKDKLKIRVSLDHFSAKIHDQERGLGAFDRTIEELKWLFDEGFDVSIASRSLVQESRSESLEGHLELLRKYKIDLNLDEKLVIFPEMLSKSDVPEITTKCWSILNKSPADQMCASERMIVKRKGDISTSVMPCTLLAYDEEFILGHNLKDADKKVYLNHRFCAEFCVLGGASCSSVK